MPNSRVGQFVLELGTLTIPSVRVTQFVLETATLPTPVSVACGNPPPGQIGAPYNHAFPGSGGLGPYTFQILSGLIPPGLSLNASTGVMSGTPTAAGTYPFTIQITDANLSSATVLCTILISGQVVRITLRGVKYVRCAPAADDATPIPAPPHVDRAV